MHHISLAPDVLQQLDAIPPVFLRNSIRGCQLPGSRRRPGALVRRPGRARGLLCRRGGGGRFAGGPPAAARLSPLISAARQGAVCPPRTIWVGTRRRRRRDTGGGRWAVCAAARRYSCGTCRSGRARYVHTHGARRVILLTPITRRPAPSWSRTHCQGIFVGRHLITHICFQMVTASLPWLVFTEKKHHLAPSNILFPTAEI